MKTLLTILGALVIFTACGVNQAAPGHDSAQAPSIPVIEVHSSAAITTTEYPASIQGKVNVEIRPQVSGILQNVLVDEGSFVTKGQALFQIDDNPFREQLNNAEAVLHAAEADVLNAELEVERLSPLVDNRVVSEFQLKAAKAKHRAARANLDQAKAQVESARINLAYTIVKAPVSGLIGRLPKKQGSLVGPADPEALTTLSDVHEVYAYFSLSERDFIRFKAAYSGNTIQDKLGNVPAVSLLLADNSVYPEHGRLDMIDGQFDNSTGAITLRASFPNSRGLLRSGNTGKIQLPIRHEEIFLIPQAATMEIQDKRFVFVLDKENKVSRKPITTVGKSGSDYLVKDGLEEGDRIVEKGIEKLQDGIVIRPELPREKIADNRN